MKKESRKGLLEVDLTGPDDTGRRAPTDGHWEE